MAVGIVYLGTVECQVYLYVDDRDGVVGGETPGSCAYHLDST